MYLSIFQAKCLYMAESSRLVLLEKEGIREFAGGGRPYGLPENAASLRDVLDRLDRSYLGGRFLLVTDDVYDLLVEKGYDPEYGARPMRRAIQDIIETALAKQLLDDQTTGNKQITLTRDNLE